MRCVLTRAVSTPGAVDDLPPGRRRGRPLGMLAAWLTLADVPSRADHWDNDLMNSALELRQLCRDQFKVSVEGLELLDKERDQLPDETEEPTELIPVYLKPSA